jgi:hypothetical protein
MPNQIFVGSEEHYLLIYSMGGKTRLQAAKKNITKSIGFYRLKVSYCIFDQISHYFVLDADNIGMDYGGMSETLAYLTTQLTEFLPQGAAFEQNAQIHTTDFGRLSCFIIADQQNIEGTLEDVLETVIQCENLIEPATLFCNTAAAIYPNRPIANDVTKKQKA